MKRFRNQKGFTLIEILLVVVIIGLILSVIVPRAWRANIDAKYGLIRQNGSELASFAQEWAEQQMVAHFETSTATINSYMVSLTGVAGVAAPAAVPVPATLWIADQTTAAGNNWSLTGAALTGVSGRVMPNVADPATPEQTVEAIIPPERIPRNPFNGASVFLVPNDPISAAVPIPGALACAGIGDAAAAGAQTHNYFALLFQGTDSTSIGFGATTSFFAGQVDNTIEGLRNGIFIARVTRN